MSVALPMAVHGCWADPLGCSVIELCSVGGHVYPSIPVEKVLFLFLFKLKKRLFIKRKRQEDNN
jgi:hypothetical protein